MDDQAHAVELVRGILAGEYTSEAAAHAMVAEFESLVPDPHAADLIFWPEEHPLSRDTSQEALTPERIVELAFRYRPFAL